MLRFRPRTASPWASLLRNYRRATKFSSGRLYQAYSAIKMSDAKTYDPPNAEPGVILSPLSRSDLRMLVNYILISDSDLLAFCLDYFPDVYSRFTSGMDRILKVTVLLEQARSEHILNALDKYSHDRFMECISKVSLNTYENPNGKISNLPSINKTKEHTEALLRTGWHRLCVPSALALISVLAHQHVGSSGLSVTFFAPLFRLFIGLLICFYVTLLVLSIISIHEDTGKLKILPRWRSSHRLFVFLACMVTFTLSCFHVYSLFYAPERFMHKVAGQITAYSGCSLVLEKASWLLFPLSVGLLTFVFGSLVIGIPGVALREGIIHLIIPTILLTVSRIHGRKTDNV